MMSENMKNACDAMGVKMPNDDVVNAIGPDAHKIITDNGFVLVPHEWRERCFKAADFIRELRAINADLLAALEILPLDYQFDDAADFKDHAAIFLRAMDAARAAIAKAKGTP
jgi:hypothetical protein